MANFHSTAIFSPSVARAAASTAKDWNQIDSWLHRLYHGRKPPKFERNPDTLKALLALCALNESADEERDLVYAVEKEALSQLRSYYREQQEGDALHAGSQIASVLCDSLPPDGSTALDVLAELTVTLDPPASNGSPEALARRLTSLQADVFALEHDLARLSALQSYLESETTRTSALVRSLRGQDPSSDFDNSPGGVPPASAAEALIDHPLKTPESGLGGPYLPPADLAKTNLELQRRVKQLADSVPPASPSPGVSGMGPGADAGHPTIPELADQEAAYRKLLAHKRELETAVATFEGLPPDVEMAKQELERRRAELRSVARQRDAVFEGLVERESPVKRK